MVDPGTLGAIYSLFNALNLLGDVSIATAALVVLIYLFGAPNRGAAVWLCAGAIGSALATVLSTALLFLQMAVGAGGSGMATFVLATVLNAAGLASFALMAVGVGRLRSVVPRSASSDGGSHA
jgi:hypothetical protein